MEIFCLDEQTSSHCCPLWQLRCKYDTCSSVLATSKYPLSYCAGVVEADDPGPLMMQPFTHSDSCGYLSLLCLSTFLSCWLWDFCHKQFFYWLTSCKLCFQKCSSPVKGHHRSEQEIQYMRTLNWYNSYVHPMIGSPTCGQNTLTVNWPLTHSCCLSPRCHNSRPLQGCWLWHLIPLIEDNDKKLRMR